MKRIFVVFLLANSCSLFAQEYGGFGGSPSGGYGVPNTGWDSPGIGGWGTQNRGGWGSPGTGSWGASPNWGQGNTDYGEYWRRHTTPYGSGYPYSVLVAPEAPKATANDNKGNGFSDVQVTGTSQYYPNFLMPESDYWEKPTPKTLNNFDKDCSKYMVTFPGPGDPPDVLDNEPSGCPSCMVIPGGIPSSIPATGNPILSPAFLNTDKYLASVKESNCKLPSYLRDLGISLYKEIVTSLNNNQPLSKLSYPARGRGAANFPNKAPSWRSSTAADRPRCGVRIGG